MTTRARVVIEREKCKGCLMCIEACNRGALVVEEKINKRGVHAVKQKAGVPCSGCGMCAVVCPDGAIRVYRART